MPVSVYMRGSKTSGSGRCMPHGRGGWDEGNGAGRPFRSQARRTSGGASARPRQRRQQSEALLLSLNPVPVGGLSAAWRDLQIMAEAASGAPRGHECSQGCGVYAGA